MGTDRFQLQMPVPLDGDIDTSDAALAGVIADRTGRADIALQAVRWRSVYEMSSRLADRYRVGRVFIATSTRRPAARALNTRVQDAWNPGRKLAAAVGGAVGQPLRLFTLLGGGAWTLLRYEPAGAGTIAPRKGLRIVTAGMSGELRDDGGYLRAAYGFAPGDVALIRPDGYIGALASAEADLEQYLARFV